MLREAQNGFIKHEKKHKNIKKKEKKETGDMSNSSNNIFHKNTFKKKYK